MLNMYRIANEKRDNRNVRAESRYLLDKTNKLWRLAV